MFQFIFERFIRSSEQTLHFGNALQDKIDSDQWLLFIKN